MGLSVSHSLTTFPVLCIVRFRKEPWSRTRQSCIIIATGYWATGVLPLYILTQEYDAAQRQSTLCWGVIEQQPKAARPQYILGSSGAFTGCASIIRFTTREITMKEAEIAHRQLPLANGRTPARLKNTEPRLLSNLRWNRYGSKAYYPPDPNDIFNRSTKNDESA